MKKYLAVLLCLICFIALGKTVNYRASAQEVKPPVQIYQGEDCNPKDPQQLSAKITGRGTAEFKNLTINCEFKVTNALYHILVDGDSIFPQTLEDFETFTLKPEETKTSSLAPNLCNREQQDAVYGDVVGTKGEILNHIGYEERLLDSKFYHPEKKGEDCLPPPTPTPTPTPTPSPTPTSPPPPPPPPGGTGGTGGSVCTDSKPATVTLLSATRTNATTAQIKWSKVAGVSNYNIQYGLSSHNYNFGVPQTGDVDSFTIGNLAANTNYCFAVRSINGCQLSDQSNEICLSGQVLGLSAKRGEVLGVSTLAATGNFEQTVGLISQLLGVVSITSGGFFLRQKKIL